MKRRGGGLKRRDLVAGLAAASLVPARVLAQSQPKMLRVGWVSILPKTMPFYAPFAKRMTELGYEEGKNFAWDYVEVKSYEDYQPAYAELVRKKADVFVAPGNEASLRGAVAAVGSLPIVMIAIDFDPIEKGYVKSLARPGGNVTGLFVRQIEMAVKRVELAREALPKEHALDFWWDTASRDQAEAAAAASRNLGFEPRLVEVSGQPPDYAAAIEQMAETPGRPIMLGASPIYLRDRAGFMPGLVARRIPVIAAFRELVEAGALMSYGIDLISLFRDLAGYVDRIAKGAHPAELPVAQPTHFDTAINLTTAGSLGIALPPSLSIRADEVIE